MTNELVLSNARIITPEEELRGALLIRDGVIADISVGDGSFNGSAHLDLEGDYLIPGLIELHTDNIERHLQPRRGVRWPTRAALIAHDSEFAALGVTTVFDGVRVGLEPDDWLHAYATETIASLNALRAAGLLKVDHYLHLRCEMTASSLLAEFDEIVDDPRIRMISVMDHTLGQRQMRDLPTWRAIFRNLHNLDDMAMDARIARSKERQARYVADNRLALTRRAAELRDRIGACSVAGHDDATEADVLETLAMGGNIAEFPTTLEAARISRERGLKIIMGAPNLLRGRSHSGNVSAQTLAESGLLDILSSDYAPSSLLAAAFKLGAESDLGLPGAIQTVTKTPAEIVGMSDRGAIEIGKRADLARVAHEEGVCVTRMVWREGVHC